MQAHRALFGLASLWIVVGCSAAPAGPTAEMPAEAPAEAPAERPAEAAAPAARLEPLTYFTTGLEPEELAELERRAPNVEFVEVSRTEALARAAEADGADVGLCTEEFLAGAEGLRWVQAWSAGVDRYLGLEGLMENDSIVFTNMQGAHGPAIAEHVFAMLLALTRQLPRHRIAQLDGRWERDGQGMTALAERTMLVVGMGGIGTEVARRADAFGMNVLATVRTPREAPPFVDELGVSDELDELLPRASVVVVCVPLTDETRGMIDAERLELLPAGSYLVNIARGPVVDTEALMDALDSGQLAGAALDVTEPEPLPSGHPLYFYENVILTPHVAGVAEVTGDRRWSIFAENVERFSRGEELINVVDKDAGY